MDLRQQFDQILSDYGFYVLMQRTNHSFFCRCWNQKYQEADPHCPTCAGLGWVSRMERHQIRNSSLTASDSKLSAEKQTSLGKVWTNAYTFYMRHDAHPRVGDIIYEVGWNGHKPMDLIQAYRITDSLPNRGDRGRIEYFSVTAKSETIDRPFKQVIVRSIGPIKNYEFM